MPKGVNHKPRIRGPYSTQACAICRAKKSKCDGAKPVCGACAASGRNTECSWGRDTDARKPRTDAHFEALQKRADSLQAYADLLERMLAKCVCQDVTSHLQFRPQEEPGGKVGGESNADALNVDEEMTQELTAPAQCLKFDDDLGGLLLNGITTPFRFRSRPPNEVSRITEVVENFSDSYVLLVDGDLSGSDAEIDWSRHLPPEVALDRKEHDRILDLSFKFFVSFNLRIVPSLFLRDMYRALSVPPSQRPPRTSYYSPMLHNALLAVSANFSDNSYIQAPKTRQYFINVALDCLQAECRKPDLSLIQAFAFLGTYYTDVGARILGDLFFAMSSRISMSLGLAVDSTAWLKSGLITHEENQARNWAHWTAFSLDVCTALYFGREFCGPQVRRTVPMPSVDEELDHILWFHPPASISPQPNLRTLTFLKSSALFVIGRDIIDMVCSLENLCDAVTIEENVTKLDLQLNIWKSQLPHQLDVTLTNRTDSTPHKLMLHCEYWWFLIILHRPFFDPHVQTIQRTDREIDHVKLCKRAAENIVELAETWSSLYSLRYTPETMLQVLFGAGTVFLLLALHATASIRIGHGSLQTALDYVERCIRHLHEMGQTWSCAARTADILRSLLHDKLGPIITRRLAPNGVPLSITTAIASLSSKNDGPAGPDGSSGITPHTSHWRDDEWTQLPPNFVSSQNDAIQFDESSCLRSEGHIFAELDMAGLLLPSLDGFGAPELWDSGLLGNSGFY
ncbi:hypothetical protein B0H11DRAFT_2268428 [Mycena galericulata]|nr:hypothetical protein B0H11DRAFT_2268428 [Mycena galericulata]